MSILISSLDLGSARVVSLCGAGGKSTLIFALAEELVKLGERVLVSTTTRMSWEQVGRWRSVRGADLQAISTMADDPGPPVIAYRDIDEARGKAIGYSAQEIDLLAQTSRFTRILVEADGSARRPLKAPGDHEPVFPATTEVVVMVAGASGLNLRLDEATVFRAEFWSQRTGIPIGGTVTPDSLAEMVVHRDGFARKAPEHARRILFINQCDDADRLAAAMPALESLSGRRDWRPHTVVLGCLEPGVRIARCARFR